MKSKPPIESLIVTVRGHRVILDMDLAALYGVPTKVFNQAIKRNGDRFPEDFLLQLSTNEWSNLRSQIVTSSLETVGKSIISHGGRRTLPLAFTEHGAIMAATVINSPKAVAMSVFVVRAFLQMREQLAANATILKRLAEIDRTLLAQDHTLSVLWEKLQPLLEPAPEPAESPRRRIGFNAE